MDFSENVITPASLSLSYKHHGKSYPIEPHHQIWVTILYNDVVPGRKLARANYFLPWSVSAEETKFLVVTACRWQPVHNRTAVKSCADFLELYSAPLSIITYLLARSVRGYIGVSTAAASLAELSMSLTLYISVYLYTQLQQSKLAIYGLGFNWPCLLSLSLPLIRLPTYQPPTFHVATGDVRRIFV